MYGFVWRIMVFHIFLYFPVKLPPIEDSYVQDPFKVTIRTEDPIWRSMVRYQFEWFVFSVGSKQTMPVASIGRVQLSDWGGQVGQVIQASLRNQQWGFIKIIPARDPKQCGGE